MATNLIAAKLYDDGWLYWHRDNQYVSSGGKYIGEHEGKAVYRPAGVTVDEGEGALPPVDGISDDCWIEVD